MYLGQNGSNVKKDLKRKATFTLSALFLSTIAKTKLYRVEERHGWGMRWQGKHKIGTVTLSEKQSVEKGKYWNFGYWRKDRRIRSPKQHSLENAFVVGIRVCDQSMRKWTETLIWYAEYVNEKKVKVVKVKSSKISQMRRREKTFSKENEIFFSEFLDGLWESRSPPKDKIINIKEKGNKEEKYRLHYAEGQIYWLALGLRGKAKNYQGKRGQNGEGEEATCLCGHSQTAACHCSGHIYPTLDPEPHKP